MYTHAWSPWYCMHKSGWECGACFACHIPEISPQHVFFTVAVFHKFELPEYFNVCVIVIVDLGTVSSYHAAMWMHNMNFLQFVIHTGGSA